MKPNREILKKAFLCWGNPELRRLKRYANAGKKKFLCGKDYRTYCKNYCG